MTKEELEKEARINLKRRFGEYFPQLTISYVMGAEPREKRIEELIALINAERERQEKCDDVHLRTITELEKENAELKEIIDNDVDKKIYVQLAKKANLADVQKGQLTKAKEIIKTFLGFAEAFGYSPSMDKFITEAEQFLKDNEVKK